MKRLSLLVIVLAMFLMHFAAAGKCGKWKRSCCKKGCCSTRRCCKKRCCRKSWKCRKYRPLAIAQTNAVSVHGGNLAVAQGIAKSSGSASSVSSTYAGKNGAAAYSASRAVA